MKTLRSVLSGAADLAIWPAYLGLAAYAARQSPLPRDVALLLSASVALLAGAALAANLTGWLLRSSGPVESVLGVPPEVTRQFRWAAFTVIVGSVVLLLPCRLLAHGLVTSGGRPVIASTIVRLLVIAFEVGVFAVVYRLVRKRSAVMRWAGEFPDRFWGLFRWRRSIGLSALAAIAGLIALDMRGFSFSSRRLSNGAVGTLIVAALCVVLHRAVSTAVGRHSWRWVKTSNGEAAADGAVASDDLVGRLRLLSLYASVALGLLLGAWVWDVDLALFRFISEQNLWAVDRAKDVYVTVGDAARAVVILAVCGLAWKHLSTLFALVVFPRIQDDPGVRFAVVTLSRYLVLGVGLLGGLSSIHLGLEKIGVVLAALGVGLGFGLQEVVSNFVCGIILLLERPIRVGDVVTVSNMSGKVERINIRATTITNGDNQSIIVPNRAFVTGDLVNWTLKDKVVRVTIRVRVALGTDPDRVSELLSAIARDDDDVLRNPVPSAFVEEFGEASMLCVLYAHVPDPSLGGRVKHRLIGQIQRRFKESEIAMAMPTRELFVKSLDPSPLAPRSVPGEYHRIDAASPTPAVPMLATLAHAPEPVEDCHRGVDE